MKSSRQSNLELLRIFSMLLIIAHHLVIHSKLLSDTSPLYAEPYSWKAYFFICFGAFGKTAINCFVLITGYFTCKQTTSLKKYAKLFFEVAFYRVTIGVIFICAGYDYFLPIDYLKVVVPFSSIGTLFVDSFLAFYLFIPFLNIIVQKTTQKQLAHLCILSIVLFCILGSIKLPGIRISTMNYVSWFMVLYIIASYIRLYPCKLFENFRLWAVSSLSFFVIACASVMFCHRLNWQNIYYFVSDSNAIIAFALGLSLFMFFKNLDIKNSLWINRIAQGTFAVLLIHDNSAVMQRWLWQHTIDIINIYHIPYAPLIAVIAPPLIFIVCSTIDQIRIHFIEHPIFRRIQR